MRRRIVLTAVLLVAVPLMVFLFTLLGFLAGLTGAWKTISDVWFPDPDVLG